MLVIILVLCICVCICCVCQRNRKNKAFNPSVSEKLPSEIGSPVYRTLTPPEIHSDLDKKEVCSNFSTKVKDLVHESSQTQEFQMQVNVAHSADVTVELEDHTIRPSQLFVKKSASSSNINETKFNGALQRTATNPTAVAHSLSSNAGWVMHVTCS